MGQLYIQMLVETILAITLIVTMFRIARFENLSGIIWAIAAILALLVAFAFIHTPYFRILVAGLVCYAAMTAYKIITKK